MLNIAKRSDTRRRSSTALLCVAALGCSSQQGALPPAAALAAPASSTEATVESRTEQAKAFAERARVWAKGGEWQNARALIDECIERDPRSAECHELLGDTLMQADDEAGAARSFAHAIELSPAEPSSYLKLAELYLAFKRTEEAGIVLGEGIRLVPSAPEQREALLRMNLLLATVAERTGDTATRVAAAQGAEALLGNDGGLEQFEVGRIFATLSPPESARAMRHLEAFQNGTCKGADARRLREQCATATYLSLLLQLNEPQETVVARVISKDEGASAAPRLPVLALAREPIRHGDAFTAWGAAFFLRSARHRGDVTPDPIAVTGYIVKTNLSEMPMCAVHGADVADAVDCRAPVPTFWLGDRPDAPEEDCIPVVGWASHPAHIYEAIQAIDGAQRRGELAEPVEDPFWGITLPDPLPARGARVTVTGTYGEAFTMASSGVLRDEVMGFLTYGSLETHEGAPELATLPGVTRFPGVKGTGADATR